MNLQHFCRLRIAITVCGGLIASLAWSQRAGDLVVSPTRAEITDKHPSGTFLLVNAGRRRIHYRLNIVDMTMGPDGALNRSASETSNSIAKYIRLSPREVTLAPGASQRVKFLATFPAGIPSGELRSHLLFEPVRDVPQRSEQSGQFGIKIDTLLAISVPIIAEVGAVTATGDLKDAKFGKDKIGWFVSCTVERQGNCTVRGDATVSFKPNKGRSSVLGGVTGVAVYYPNASRQLRIPLSSDPTKLGSGELEVSFAPSSPRKGSLKVISLPVHG